MVVLGGEPRRGRFLTRVPVRDGRKRRPLFPAGIGEIHAFEIFAFVALIFFVIFFPLTRLAAYLEKRLA